MNFVLARMSLTTIPDALNKKLEIHAHTDNALKTFLNVLKGLQM